MSERIAELAKEAGITFEPRFGLASTGNTQIERFAKLVAKDCADLAQHHYLGHELEQAIRERYGL